MSDFEENWIGVATFTSGCEADIFISRLQSEGIAAVKRSNDAAGVFGAGSGGVGPSGYSVLVPHHAGSEAVQLREHLAKDAEMDDRSTLDDGDSPPDVRDRWS